MQLETLDQRYDLVTQMVDEALELTKTLSDLEDDNDWGGAVTAWENMSAVMEMICVEEIFLDALDDMRDVRTSDRDTKEGCMGILLVDGLHTFSQEILVPRLEHGLNVLSTWGFRTERGKEFEKDFAKKIDALIKKYKSIYSI